MKKRSYPAIAFAFCVSAIAIGFSYWQLPYSQVTLPNSLIGIGLIVPLAAGIVVRATGITKFHETLLIIGAVFVVVVLVRIVADVVTDPKTHNLWPFEVIISSIVGLVIGTIAAGIGSLVNALFAQRFRDE